ncbi:hypothetical protein ACIHDR_48450 [Nocardia sp. NPDC052278]|uniref:hypothetical protein n=1 Tax=unclassified Nocardia TaxID=2637762 RepID=UPI003689F25E
MKRFGGVEFVRNTLEIARRPRPFGARLRATMAALAVAVVAAASVVAGGAGTAAADGCGSDRAIVGPITKITDSVGVVVKPVGDFYIGYIASCRMAYAEVHWYDGGSFAPTYIWLQDANGAQYGVAQTSGHMSGFWTSQLVSIDSGIYSYARPYVQTRLLPGTPNVCNGATISGAMHNFGNGSSSGTSDHHC